MFPSSPNPMPVSLPVHMLPTITDILTVGIYCTGVLYWYTLYWYTVLVYCTGLLLPHKGVYLKFVAQFYSLLLHVLGHTIWPYSGMYKLLGTYLQYTLYSSMKFVAPWRWPYSVTETCSSSEYSVLCNELDVKVSVCRSDARTCKLSILSF
jgi:hypothetical protein